MIFMYQFTYMIYVTYGIYKYAYTSLNIYMYTVSIHIHFHMWLKVNPIRFHIQEIFCSFLPQVRELSRQAEVYEEQLRTLQSEMEAIDEEAMNLPGDGNSTGSQKKMPQKSKITDHFRNFDWWDKETPHMDLEGGN